MERSVTEKEVWTPIRMRGTSVYILSNNKWRLLPSVCDLGGVVHATSLANPIHPGKKNQMMSTSYTGPEKEKRRSEGAMSIFYVGVCNIQINVSPFLFKYLVFRKHHAVETCGWARKKLISLTLSDSTNPRSPTATYLEASRMPGRRWVWRSVFLFSPIRLPG